MVPHQRCPFCAIANGGDDSVEIVRDQPNWIAFFPTEPATPGHTLIIPRVHVPDLWAADGSLACELTEATIEVGHAIRDALEPAGLNLITSAGNAAEQTVFHLHLHVVPRWPDDEVDIWPPKKPMRERVKDDLAEAIRQAFRSD